MSPTTAPAYHDTTRQNAKQYDSACGAIRQEPGTVDLQIVKTSGMSAPHDAVADPGLGHQVSQLEISQKPSPAKRTRAQMASIPTDTNTGPNRQDTKYLAGTPRPRPKKSGKPHNRKPEASDPDFVRALPGQSLSSPRDGDDGNRPKRLFNPNIDDARTFKLLGPDQSGIASDDAPKRKQAKNRTSAGILQRDVPPMSPTTIAQHNPTYTNHEAKAQKLDVNQRIVKAPTIAHNESEEPSRMVRQPVTRPISPEQLIAEVKGIYAGLIMVEAKCCEVDAKQHQAALEMDGNQPSLNNEQWQALIALHRTLLHEHHDFFLASQHPSASQSLKRLAHKYAMPARMWRHGIHSFLELLRHRLPHSLEHMLTFIYLAYSMMALLYETVPAFEDTWIECLGDLGRYRMAIEDDDPRDREVWQNVARFWYSKAADKTPSIGRLYHHLAILARPNILQQLFYYCKSLGVSTPFNSARESILTVFDPIFNPDVFGAKSQPVEASFIQLHSITFSHIEFEKFDVALDAFLDLLDKHISRPQTKWKVQGFYMAVCNITALYQYGARDSLLRKAWKDGRKTHPVADAAAADQEMEEPPFADAEAEAEAAIASLLPPYGTENAPAENSNADDQEMDAESADLAQSIQSISLNVSKRLAFTVFSLTLEHFNDPNTLPHIHAWMVFIAHLTASVPAMRLIENQFPWGSLVEMLNELRAQYEGPAEMIENSIFPGPEKGVGRPLPEDYNLRGFEWSRNYFPERWFEDAQIDSEERNQELPSMTIIRCERILWLATRICAADDWITYDSTTKTFAPHPALEQRMLEARKRTAAVVMKREKREGVPMEDDIDVDMIATGYSNSEEEEYIMIGPEFRKLKEQKRQLEAQLQAGPRRGHVITPEAIAEVSRSALVKGPEAMSLGTTSFIVDTNLLVNHLETFGLVTREGWAVIIPNCVITELRGLGNSPSVGDSAKSAMIAINKAIADRKDIKIITAKGSDVTKMGFFKEKLERDENETRNIDDIIIRTTKILGESRRQAFAARGVIGFAAETAILLTEDTNMRVKANARGVPAISTTILKRFLVQLRNKSKTSPPQPKRKSAGPVTPRIKYEHDDDEMFLMGHPQDMDTRSKIPPVGKRRTIKARKTDLQPNYAPVR